MILHCPHCGMPIESTAAVLYMGKVVHFIPSFCPICKKHLVVADERWRTETCGTCGFRVERPHTPGDYPCDCRRRPPCIMGSGYTAYPGINERAPACAEWAERRGE